MLNFNIAAEAAEIGEDEDVVEVPLGDKIYKARRPTTAQMALLVGSQSRQDPGTMFRIIESILGAEAREFLEEAILDRRIDFGDLIGGGTELNPDRGLLDGILEEFSGRPTQPSTDSASSQAAGGRKSTARSRGKGSISSSSPRTGS